tara:strand:+ start:9021 stop:10166 length:1146 start_codon:yes stop_codon:yes gene_type:complete
MAYNVLKGVVEGSVDQYGDQEIDGIKVFKNTISASVFYDTDAQSPCATMKDVAINEVAGGVSNSVLTFQGEGKAKAEHNLSFDGRRLTTKEVCATAFIGAGEGLYNVPADKLSGKVPADSINIGPGIRSVRGKIQVRPGKGLEVNANGATVALGPQGGLSFKDSNLVASPNACLDVTLKGQNLSDGDFLMVHDTSRNEVRKTTLANLYNSYLNAKLPHPEGPTNSVQLRGRKGFVASANFTYDPQANVLGVLGETKTNLLTATGQVTFQGAVNNRSAVHNNITTVTNETYDVADSDYTVLCDTTKNIVLVTLPPACNHAGRVIVIKKVNKDKYKLNSNVLTVQVKEGMIDYTEHITVKYNNSSRVVQSDGENWWIIGKAGS